MDDRRGIAQDLGNLGEVYVETDRFDAAAEVLAESLQLLQALGDKRSEAISQAAIGDLHRKRGELTEADFAYSRAIELARASQDPIAAGEIQWRLCGLLTSMGCAAEARHLAETILDTLRPVDHRLTSEIEAFLFTTPPA
jgi:tetratricopeptide (TPR) repeat protein